MTDFTWSRSMQHAASASAPIIGDRPIRKPFPKNADHRPSRTPDIQIRGQPVPFTRDFCRCLPGEVRARRTTRAKMKKGGRQRKNMLFERQNRIRKVLFLMTAGRLARRDG
jgi:hypothetical protein